MLDARLIMKLASLIIICCYERTTLITQQPQHIVQLAIVIWSYINDQIGDNYLIKVFIDILSIVLSIV